MSLASVSRRSVIFFGLSISTVVFSAEAVFSAESKELPKRSGPIPTTTRGVPHVQIGVRPVPEISKELLRLVSRIKGVEVRNTVISLPGALGFWINKSVKLARPDAIVGGREFAHLHPDGSLHASLSPELARRAVAAGWATPHPWAKSRPGWQGFVMIYTPKNKSELKTVFRLVVGSYNFVTGKSE